MAGPGGVLVGRGYVVIRPEFQGDWDRRVHAQTSRSGTSGGRAFGTSFAKAAGAGLSGLSTVLKSSLAGSALAATAVGLGNIGSAALAASAVAVPALSAIGTAGAAIGIGFKGIGKAFKAFDSAAQDATAAASATRAVKSAQRALGKAQQSVAEARVAAARRVQDAERAVVDAQRDATRAHEDSTDAQRVAIDVQNELTAARRDATRQLEDYRLRIADAAIDQEEAAQRVRDAERDLADARKTTDKDAIARAELAVRRAKLGVEQQAQDFKRLREEEAAATKAGVDGSEQVLAARERIANANDRAKDAAERAVEADRNVIEAQRGVAEAHVDGSRQIAAAQESVADAARALADAQQAAASQVSKVDDALAKLTPNAREFVETVKDLGPAWGEVRKATQESLFKGVADSFRSMSTQIIPDLKSGLSGAATQINAMWRNWMDGVARLSREGSLKKFFDGNNRILEDFAKWPAEATRGWVQLSIAATPALERITTAVGDASTRLSERMDKAFESGAMERAITRGLDALVALKPTLSDIGTVFSNVFGAISGPGSQAIGVFGIFLDELVRVTSLPKVKQAITDIFTAFSDIAGLFLGALGKVLEYGLPLLATGLTWIADVAPRAVAGLVSFGQAVGEKLRPPLLAAAEGTRDLFAAMASGDSAKASGSASVMERIGAAARGFGDQAASGVRSFFDAFKSGDLAPKWFTASPGLDGVFDRMGVAARAAGDIIRDQLAPALLGLGRGLADFIIPVVQSVGRIYTEHLQHTFERIATVIHRALVPIMEALGKFIEDRLAPALQTLGAKFANLFDRLNPIIGALDSVITFVFKVGATLAGYLAPILIDLAGPVFTFLVKAIGFGIDAIALLLQGVGSLGKGAVWLWDNALKPAFTAIGDGVKWLRDKVEPVFDWIKDSIRGWGIIAQLVWDNMLSPVFTAVADGAKVLWDNALKPVFGWITDSIRGWGIIATWLWENAVKPAFDGIAGAATWLWREAIKPSIDSIVDGFQSIGRWAENTYNNVADWFGKIGDKIGDVVGGFVDAFATARDSVGAVWSAVMGKVASPINWIIDKVYGGLRSVWNTVADKVGLGSLKLDAIGQIEAPPAAAPAGRQHAFAAGGIYPGYTPGRDIGMAAVSGGEAIMRPEWTRAVGPGYIHAANRAAVSGGMGGVEKFLGANGVPYAGKFALGGIVDDAVDWAKGLARGAAAKGLEIGMKPVRAGINQAPDSPDWWRIGKQIPIRWIDAMIDKVRGEDAKWASSGVLSGLSWARSQAGKPYQWGGSGNPSWDCCIVGTVRVYGPNGATPIKDVRAGDEVFSYVDGKLTAQTVTAAWQSKTQPVFKVRTRNRTVVASANHPFMRLVEAEPYRRVKGGVRGENVPARYDVEWLRLDELQRGDLLITPRAMSSDHVVDPALPDGTRVTNDIAWLLGLFIGDGYLTGNTIRICVYDDNSVRAQSIFRSLGINSFTSAQHGVIASSVAFVKTLDEGMGLRCPGPDKRVPAAVWTWDAELRQAFLDGYCAADGHRPADQAKHGERTYASSSRELLEDVRALHMMLGQPVSNISTNYRTKPIFIKGIQVKNALPLHTFTVWHGRGRGEVALRKRPGIAAWLDAGDFTVSRILEISDAGVQETWDLEVEGAHNFVADGVVVHNSGFMAAIQEVILGHKPRRLWTTFDFLGNSAPDGWKRGADAPFRVGVTNLGVGHMAGTLLGTNVESRGGDGVVVGPSARGADHRMFYETFGFLPSLGSTGGNAPSGALASWISQALAATGTPPPGSLAAWMSGMATLVGRESGGNPFATNTTDSNARAGNASRGLAQVVPTTFQAYHQPGTSWDIFDPVANLSASVRYIKSVYGDISRVQQADPNRDPKGYSFGGIVPRGGGTHDDGGWLQHGELGLNMSGSPEAVLTTQEWRDVRGLVANRSALDQAVALLAGRNEAPFIEHYHAAKDEDPRRLAEEQRALTRSRGPRS